MEEVPHMSHLLHFTLPFFKRWLPKYVQACHSEEALWNGHTFSRNCRIFLAFSLRLVTARIRIRGDMHFTGVILALSFLPSSLLTQLCDGRWQTGGRITWLGVLGNYPVCVVGRWSDMGRQWNGRGVAVLGRSGARSDCYTLRDRGGGRSALIGRALSILRVNMEL